MRISVSRDRPREDMISGPASRRPAAQRASKHDPRRRFLLTIGGSSLLCLVPGGLAGCGASLDDALGPWSAPQLASSDPRLVALSYALLAPSSHNTQPWLVDLQAPDRIDLYADATRALPEVDERGRQLVQSQATFLEVCAIALRRVGFSPRVLYLPGADPETAVRGSSPVASVVLESGRVGQEEPLFEAIRERHTNRRPYAPDRPIPAAHLDAIGAAARVQGAQLSFVTERAGILELATMCREAMAVEVSDRTRNEELARWFRFDDGEIQRQRDGFGLAQGGTDGFAKWMAETFLLSRSAAADPAGTFAKKSIELTWKQASSASAFGLLTTPGNERSDQLDAGRGFVRAQLSATSSGIQSQPHFQLLEEYAAMAPLAARFRRAFAPSGRTVQMLFRLGYAEATVHSPRRPLTALLVRAPAEVG